MEFQSPQHHHSAVQAFPVVQQRPRNAALIMSSCGTYPVQPQHLRSTSQPTPNQPFSSMWALGNTAPYTFPPRNTAILNNRVEASRYSSVRPTTMAAEAMKSFGVQNPQGEYLPQPAMSQPPVQPTSMPPTSLVPDVWAQSKDCGEFDFGTLEPDLPDFGPGSLHHEENTSIIDLRQFTNLDGDNSHDIFYSNESRRMSESSFSISSIGLLADVPSMEDWSTAELPLSQDCDWINLEPVDLNSNSPIISSRPPQHEALIRTNSRSRSSPVPNLRSSPYTLDSGRDKRWSTGMYQPTSIPPATTQNLNQYSSFFGSSPLNPHAVPTFANDMGAGFHSQAQNYMFPQGPQHHNGMIFSAVGQAYPEAPQPLPSQGLFRFLQSNNERHTGCSSHFADLSDPPDLYSSLLEEPCNPPEEDMNPEDPEMVPHEQDLRFQGDLYTPRWVRGHGNKREGWCGLCKPGRWLVLKNSAFWYDKSFTHGVSAATGAAFQGPQDTRRTEGNMDVWEGLCGSCGDWIALVSSKKKGTTWFRHAYKCHTHPKVKDGPKRRRETTAMTTSNQYTSAPSNASIVQPALSNNSPGSQSAAEPVGGSNLITKISEVKTENNHKSSTPLSTPQLSHTTLSTPQIPNMQTPSSQQHQPQDQNNHLHQVIDLHSIHNFQASGIDIGEQHNQSSPKPYQEGSGQEYQDHTLPQFSDDTFQDYSGFNLMSFDMRTVNPMDSLGFANIF